MREFIGKWGKIGNGKKTNSNGKMGKRGKRVRENKKNQGKREKGNRLGEIRNLMEFSI